VRTDFLFAMPTWLSGTARSLDLAGQFDEYNDDDLAADANALANDWRAVGESLADAMRAFTRDPHARPHPIE
jgi:hypothetical protein